MKTLSVIVFLSLCCGLSAAQQTISWAFIAEGEARAEQWVNALTVDEMLALGRMRQQPAELELVRAFYPYLLPEGFFNRNIELTCYPAFVAFQQQRDPQSFKRWQQCIRELWRDAPPALIAQALQQLKP